MTIYPLIRPALFRIDAENAHRMTIAALQMVPPALLRQAVSPRLATTVAGLSFPSPVGLAAGFDKNAEVPDQMLALGFGFAEVGTLTPRPQQGNPRPRLFRLVEDRAVINRMGFNNGGQDMAVRRLSRRRRGGPGVVGINIGANKDSADRVADYSATLTAFAPLADYITLNISSPNTPGLRALQSRAALDELLHAVLEARAGLTARPPVFLKVAPDLEPADVDDIAAVTLSRGIDALIVSNTTIARPSSLLSRHKGEAGGLSGAPLREPALTMLRRFRAATGGRLPLIGVGGIASAQDAYARIRAGASLVQLYSALVYEGPGLIGRINAGLVALLNRDGLATIGDAVGADAV